MTELDRTASFFMALEEGRLEEANEILKENYDLLEKEDGSGEDWQVEY